MPVIGAVLHLDAARLQGTRDALEADHHITLGPLSGTTQPVVIETTSRREDKAVWSRLEQLAGVLLVQPVFADFSDLLETGCPPTVASS